MTMLAQGANYLRTGRVALFPKRGSFAAERPHPPTALARRKCRTGPSARRVRGPQCHPRAPGWGAGAVAHRRHCRGPPRGGYRGRATVHPHRRGTHSPMRRPALGRNPGPVEEQGRRPWVLGTAPLFFGRFGQQLSISSLNSANGWAPTIFLASLTPLPSLTPSSRVGVPVIPSFWPSAMLLLIVRAYLPLSGHSLKGSA